MADLQVGSEEAKFEVFPFLPLRAHPWFEGWVFSVFEAEN